MLKRVGLEPTPHKRDQETLLRTALTYVLLVKFKPPSGGYRTWRHNLLNLLAKFKLGMPRVPNLGCA